jgi:DNA-binding transcriptional ArsR family regulator
VAAANVDQTIAALADPARRGVIDLLRQGPRRAGELADELGMGRPAMSRHLRMLRHTGLVTEESPLEDARARVYQLRREPFVELRSWLDEVEDFWSLQLESFREHANRSRRSRRTGSVVKNGRKKHAQ